MTSDQIDHSSPAAGPVIDPVMAGRVRAVKERPYFAVGLWAMTLVPSEEVDTLACDEYWRVYYNPTAVAHWKVEETAGVLIHELGHLLREHFSRARAIDADPDLGNKSGDCEINDDILKEGLSLPRTLASLNPETGAVTTREFTPCTPSVYGFPDDLLFEQYYELMLERAKQSPASGGQGSGKKGGKKKGSGSPPPGPGQGAVGSGRCGSAATGRRAPYELPAPDKGNVPGVSHAEGGLLRQEVARQIVEHSKTRGNISAGWRRWAEEKIAPRLDVWKEIQALVRRAVSEASGQMDFSYRRRSRRQSAFPDVVLPALRRPVPDVAVVLDTSASVSDQMIAVAISRIAGVLAGLGLQKTVTVLSVDAAVHSCQQVFRPDQITPLGGGGTDMRVGFERALKLKPKPQVIVCLTDAETPWPATAPRGTKVVIGLLGDGETPSWARVVKIKTDAN